MTTMQESHFIYKETWFEEGRYCPYEQFIQAMKDSDPKRFCRMFGAQCPAGDKQMHECNRWLEQGEQEGFNTWTV